MTIETITKRIEGKEKEITKLEKRMSRILADQATGFQGDYCERDLKWTTRDMEGVCGMSKTASNKRQEGRTMFVALTDWTRASVIDMGKMHIKNINEKLREYEKVAHKMLEETGADHVIYGVKYYDDNDRVEKVHLHMTPMDENTFCLRTEKLENALVYAVHKRS